ncbi:unnamed protein product [Sphenostylis stenocarpa]|uniref:Uncharacterized protein n=1 Tax=Sphenostylis stenocarpa TaxID=92480 RepID=A0AA86W2F7_9FABA|nr:unnamed protein product [Sphenostylis stenocarpa]
MQKSYTSTPTTNLNSQPLEHCVSFMNRISESFAVIIIFVSPLESESIRVVMITVAIGTSQYHGAIIMHPFGVYNIHVINE